MANHSFNTTLAKRYSIEEAILIEHLYWWIHKNECNEDMQKDGRTWCYSSAKGFERYLEYMNGQKVRRILLKLQEKGKIMIGNYNKSAINQTLWYAFTDEMIEELASLNYNFSDFSKVKNGFFKSEKCKEDNIIEDNNHNNNLSKQSLSKSLYEGDSLFVEFWTKYNKSVDKKKTFIAFKNLSKKDKLAAIAAIDTYRNSRNQDNRYIKNPLTYIHSRTWEDDFESYTKQIKPYDVNSTDSERVQKFKAYMRSNFPEIEETRMPLCYEHYIELVKQAGVDIITECLQDIEREIWKYRKSDIAQVIKERIKESEL